MLLKADIKRSICLLVTLFGRPTRQHAEHGRKLSWVPELDTQDNPFMIKNDTFFSYISQWNTSISENEKENEGTVSEEEPYAIDAQTLFQSSSNDSSMVLSDLTSCLTHYNFYACMQMLLLSRVKPLVTEMDRLNTTGVDLHLMRGLITFKWLNLSENFEHESSEPERHSDFSLNHELNTYILRLFKSRSLQVSLFPGFGLEFTPKRISDKNGLVCFAAKAFSDPHLDSAAIAETRHQAGSNNDKKKKKKDKGGGFNMMPMMIVPQMIMLGMLPFALANLKMMVMNAFMMNSMALNSAIFMTIRNMVFGPKNGPKVKYVNYGYNKAKVNKKPELILHSPAAFVKKPDSSHHFTHHPPNANMYDNPNSYQVDSPGYVRRTVSWKHKNKNDKTRIRTKVRHPEPSNGNQNEFSPYQSNTYGQESNLGLYNFQDQASNLDANQYEQPYASDVDAPISYLNNNQFLQPTISSQQNINKPTYSFQQEPAAATGTANDASDYQFYNNVYLQSHSQQPDRTSDSKTKHTYSSQYNESPSDAQKTNDYYKNHKIFP